MSNLRVAALFGLALALSGCAWENSLEHLAAGSGLATAPTEAKDFVKASRPDPANLNYIAVGFDEKKRATAVRTTAEVAADDRSLRAASAAAHIKAGNALTADKSNSPGKKHKKPIEDPILAPKSN